MTTKAKVIIGSLFAAGAIGYLVLSKRNTKQSVREFVLSKNWYHPSGELVNYAIKDAMEDGTVVLREDQVGWSAKLITQNQIQVTKGTTSVIWTAK